MKKNMSVKVFFLSLIVFMLVVVILNSATVSAEPMSVYVDDNYTDEASCTTAGHTWNYDCFSTIQEAINTVAENGTVNITAGTYTPTSTIIINKTDITILGPKANIDPRPSQGNTRTAGSADEAIIDGSAYSLGKIIQIDANNVVINGLEVKSGKADMIRQDNIRSGTKVKYCMIHDGRGDEGTQLTKCTNCAMEYNYVYDIATPGDALNFADSTSCTIQFNEVYNISSENAAIYVYGSTNTEIVENLVHYVTQNDGIKLGDKNGNDASKTGGLVKDNVVYDTEQDGITVYMSGVTIEGNEIYNSRSENGAIYIAFNVNDITITKNNVHNNTLKTGKWGNPGAIMIGTAVNASTVHVNFNNIANNLPNGFTNKAIALLDAVNNYWGRTNGPTHAVNNPYGDGDAVSDNVDFAPWYIDSGLTMLISEAPEEGQALADSEDVIVEEGKTEIVVPVGSPVQTINISDTVADDTQVTLDLSSMVTEETATEKKVTLTNDLTLSRDTSTAIDYEVKIPTGTTVSGPTDWTGVMNIPTVKATSSVTPTADAGTTASVATVVEVGYGDTKLTFDKAVRLLITGQAGKLAGYSRGGVFYKITTTCTDDTQATNDLLPADTECKIDVGSDMVIWTKHFTTFAAYTQAPTPPASTGGGSGASFPGTISKTPKPSTMKVPTPAVPVQKIQQVPLEQPTIRTEEEKAASIPTGQTVSELAKTGGSTMKAVLLIIGLVLIVTLSIWMISRKGKRL